MYSVNKGVTCPKGEDWFYVHSFNEIREFDSPILKSIKKKVDKANFSSKCNQIHLTPEMEEEYKEAKNKYCKLKEKCKTLDKENDQLFSENKEIIIKAILVKKK